MTRSSEATGVVITVAGVEHHLDAMAVTGLDAREFRRQTGQPFASVLANLDALDLDLVAGLVWMARRQAGEIADFDEIAGSLTYADDPSARVVEVEPDPET